jgi:geranylgeranyl pyrophosphate synthase
MGSDGVQVDGQFTAGLADGAGLDNSAILASPRYIQSLPSKNIRSRLVDAFNIWFQLPADRVNIIKGIINDLHDASLILDDIHDGSILRRGSPTAHCVFGPAQCINSATYMVVQAVTRINHAKYPQVLDACLDGLTNLSVGQSWDLNWKFNLHCPSTAEYMNMIDGKTGAMFKMLARMMKSMSPSQNWPVADLDKLTELFGRWYQVRDDYQNLHDPVYAEQKGFCEDLDEGKLSYPVVLCCISDPGARVIILDVFRRNRNGTVLALDVKMQILDLIRKSGALDETWQVIQQLRKEVEDTISILETDIGEPNPSLRLIMKFLGDIRPP